MRLLEVSFKSPEKNLAFDEVLLNEAESGHGGEALRFWESRKPFVVLGVAQALRQEVFEKACCADGIPILRRCSAGGCVVQGPGCLNFTLVLSHRTHPQVKTVRESYCYILGRIEAEFRRRNLFVRHKGISDLAMGRVKVSGNAQRRRREWVLHHGTLLYRPAARAGENFEGAPQHAGQEGETPLLALIERYLREPIGRPQYRGERKHRAFVGVLPLPASELREIVRDAFGVGNEVDEPRRREVEAAAELAREKYASFSWTWRR